ncbi:sigma-54-dependent transcriptional regulator [Desulfovermiculus halophilus]|jgi:two-component system NtrC family response regulator|uniref:sigma-54-dependent transcriptional regulator n=1 Tax=Desulfovermiculus halophilus TaxID=339722 RepID=UPI0004829C79|nr:sigma-54 dependent transcriptional regulator [Desulfovermiculus halophilus]
MPAHILVIDDEQNYLLLLDTLLADEGYSLTTLQDPELALEYLVESDVDVVITDMKMPRVSGQDVLEHIKKNYPHIPVLIMTAYGSIDGAVQAMRCGAFDYIAKPFSNDELLLSVHKAVKMSEAEQQNRLLRQSLQEKHGSHNIIGRSQGVRQILDLVARVAPSTSNVLITGESGTGKELIAKALHYGSNRQNGPFISVNCMALNPGVMESELFGHEKGSFTGATVKKRGRFELAHTGTLFLDEIGELSFDTQVKLLRVIQEHSFERVGGSESIHVDIRLVAATNKDLQQEVEEGRFREDLFYRLNVVNIHIPPLRERVEDIPLLAAHFLHTFSQENNKDVQGFSPQAMQALTAYHWPGNVRQLENIVERCVVLARGATIGLEDLPAEFKEESTQYKSAADLLPTEINLGETLEKIEAALIRRALVRSNFVQVKAAETLGISKSLLQYKLKKYNISGKQ